MNLLFMIVTHPIGLLLAASGGSGGRDCIFAASGSGTRLLLAEPRAGLLAVKLPAGCGAGNGKEKR
ncbi:MAG: hypothetical protein ABIN83_03300 [Sphingomicrobium sp.]